MSRESNKEIDVLLRKLSGKRNGNSAADTISAAGADEHLDHLDADELNAYSEQALPAATRARYTAHLADCGRCRQLVTQLSLSSTATFSTHAEEQAPSKLKMFLASLFSPLVIRYAVPAMAILVVIALAWVAMRRSPMAQHVARNIDQQATGPAVNSAGQLNPPASEPKTASGLDQANDQRTVGTDASNKALENKQAKIAEEQRAAEAPPAPPVASRNPEIDQSTDVAKRPQPSAPVAAPAVATSSVAGAKPATEADKNEGTRQKKDESAAARDVKEKEEDRTAFQKAPQAAASGPSKTERADRPSKGQSVDTQPETAKLRAARREAPPKDAPREQSPDVRSVGGHRFERRGQVWVDVLYQSQSTINVARDSEQYRALVGDEPGIRTIAEQLSGELIVVWKSRAYRIR